MYHQWIEFYDARGKGWAELDGFVELKDRVLLVECKLTGGPYGRLQMEWLYKPLLEKIFGKPVICLLVCKWVTPETPGPFVNSPEEAIAKGLEFSTWPWSP